VPALKRHLGGALLVCAGLAAFSVATPALAQFVGKASATGQFESNSNIFALDSGFAQPGIVDYQRGDSFFAYGAGFDGKYLWGRQDLYASASANEYDYQHYSELNHDDYKVNAGLDWKLGELLDGKLDVVRDHEMVPFFDLSGSGLALSVITEQKETVKIGLKLSSVWKIEGSAYTSKADQPVVDAPNLQLTQTSGTTSIEYLGIAGLTSGLTASYLTGDYSGTYGTLNPSYNQSMLGFLASYNFNRATIDGQIGYSRRRSEDGVNNTSGLTGLLDVKYQVTRKTNFTAKIDRVINSYFLNAGSEIDTDASVNINWQATYKLAVSTGYTFTYRDYPGQGNNPVGSNRVDIQQYATLGIGYQARRWLLIRPYANLQKRISTFIGGEYSATIFGVYVTVTYPDRPR
jgi:hypothetical protein